MRPLRTHSLVSAPQRRSRRYAEKADAAHALLSFLNPRKRVRAAKSPKNAATSGAESGAVRVK